MVLAVNCCVSLSNVFSFNNYVSLRYIQFSLGNKVLSGKELPNLLAICSFCGCIIVFVVFLFGVGGLMWI